MWPLIKIIPTLTHFRFVAFARIAAVLSILAVVGSLFMTIYPMTPPCGGLNCGIDFKGGTVLEFATRPKLVDLRATRETVARLARGDVQLQAFATADDPNAQYHAMTRFQTPGGVNPAVLVQQVKASIVAIHGPQTAFSRADVVGPKVSGELFRNGILALGLAIGLMLVYIWFRFELQFGLGAVAALFHDVILTFGLIAVTRMEFSLTTIAAILTIIGYSMNDTVVVFDRLRENLRKYKKMPLREVIDLSINETLSRTVITGLTAILALGGLAVFGGEALYQFSIIMMFGIALGTYSSIYVAAPIILLWGVKRGEEEATPIKPMGATTNR